MTTNNTQKNYRQTKSKLRTSFEDVQYLIALHIELLDKIEKLENKVKLMWSSISNITTGV